MKIQNSQNDSSWISSLLNEGEIYNDARRYYLENPWSFAIEDPEERYDAIISHNTMTRACEREFLGFSKYQRAYLKDFVDVRLSNMITVTGRGCSKTFLMNFGTAILAYCLPRFSVTINAGSLKQAQRSSRFWRIFAEADRMDASQGGPLLEPPRATITRLKNAGTLEILAASEMQAKAPHPHLVVYDEACAADPYIMELVEGQLVGGVPPAGATSPLYRIQSTGDKLYHPFRDKWRERKALGFKGHTWGARDCPWMTEEYILQLEIQHDQNWIDIHIEGRFGSATGTIFNWKDIEVAIIPSLEEDPIWKYVKENPHHVLRAVLGVDWGYKHPTVMIVLLEIDIPRPEAKANIPDVERDIFPLYYFVHIEGHSGGGAGFVEFILDRIQVIAETWNTDVYADSSDKMMNEQIRERLSDSGLRFEGVAFSRYNMALIGAMRSLLEKRIVRIPRGKGERLQGNLFLEQLSSYEWERDREKPVKKFDDYVDAGKLAAWGMMRGGGGSRVIVIRR